MPRREPSLRARARVILRETTSNATERADVSCTPFPDPPPQAGRECTADAAPLPAGTAGPAPVTAAEPSLTDRVRDLFERSALPVREIARLAGVTERTIYKYAAKHQWKPRYRWQPHDPAKRKPVRRKEDAPVQESKAGARHRRWQPEAPFAPAKGAGGRFVARERAGAAHPVGLKATDPAAAARAAAACVRAGEHAAAAQAKAERARRAEACVAAVAQVHAALARLNAHARKQSLKEARLRRVKGEGARADAGAADRLSLPLRIGVRFALLLWERALREMED